MCYTKGKRIRFYRGYYKPFYKGNRVKYGYDVTWGIVHYAPIVNPDSELCWHLRRIEYKHDYEMNKTILWDNHYTIQGADDLRDTTGFPIIDNWRAYPNYGGTYRGFCRFLKEYSKIFPNGTIFRVVHDKYDIFMESVVTNHITREDTFKIIHKGMEDWCNSRGVEIISAY